MLVKQRIVRNGTEMSQNRRSRFDAVDHRERLPSGFSCFLKGVPRRVVEMSLTSPFFCEARLAVLIVGGGESGSLLIADDSCVDVKSV